LAYSKTKAKIQYVALANLQPRISSSEKIVNSICQYLNISNYLMSLDLSWNNITPKFGKLIFESLHNLEILKHLNYSYNFIRN